MIKLSILFVLLASPYQVQRQNPVHDNRRTAQIVRYLRQQNPAVLQKVMRAMKWQKFRKPKKCPKLKQKNQSEYDKWENKMLLDLMFGR